ncbi:hypothetical protein CH063_06622 [Colletotrichum higginsianum]|uniref:SnoaL-like domain-containing protein n=1 Tax=Colletotrichum higginsianum (strain IMI 349063) TaxID=759273 RepID=H1V372_COLHI|nr:hypothetical protein CH63R_06265 [Colletotrichum higginsianum IMI 349063]OBR10573.1 hypothetical protein CH63R_06265 [Colletotrichum higginsianum IMI 349063]CCF34674.1 hypothetical protein CH063_06622 [Colletotrichum higginsianum]
MKSSIFLSLGLLLGAAKAIDMREYAPECGVDRGFRIWYRELLASFEDATTTEGILDWFAPGGVMVLGDQGAAGDEILQARGAILPADGSVQWNHFPNTTIVSDETPTNKSFVVSGVLQLTNGTCATTYFQTLFTVEKDPTTGQADLESHGGRILVYHGFSINATTDPCIK